MNLLLDLINDDGYINDIDDDNDEPRVFKPSLYYKFDDFRFIEI